MADAYDYTTPAASDLMYDPGNTANSIDAQLRAIKAAITASSPAGSRASKFLVYTNTGSVIVVRLIIWSDLPFSQAAHVAPTAGATLAQLETNVNAILSALQTAGIMA